MPEPPAVVPRHLLHHPRVAGVAEADAAVLLWHDEAEESELAHVPEKLFGHLAEAIELRRVHRGEVFRNRVDQGADGLLLLGVHLRIREELILEDLAEEERLAETRLWIEGHDG